MFLIKKDVTKNRSQFGLTRYPNLIPSFILDSNLVKSPITYKLYLIVLPEQFYNGTACMLYEIYITCTLYWYLKETYSSVHTHVSFQTIHNNLVYSYCTKYKYNNSVFVE